MKKIFLIITLFSLTPLISFSNNNIVGEIDTIIIEVDCNALANDVFHIWYDKGFSQEYSTKKANEAKDECKKDLVQNVD